MATISHNNRVIGNRSPSPSPIISSPSLISNISSNNNNAIGANKDTEIPTITLVKTPLNNVEIDFSAKATKEGTFSLFSNALEKKNISFNAKEMTIIIEPPESSLPILNSPILNNSGGNGNGIGGIGTTKLNQQQLQMKTQDDLSTLFELIHHCIFFSPISNSNGNSKKQPQDIYNNSTGNNYFCQIIRETPSNIKIITNTLFEVFGHYLDLARKYSEDDESNSKKLQIFINSMERFIQDSLSTNGGGTNTNSMKFRDTMDFSLQSIQKIFITHLNDQIKLIKNTGGSSNAGNTNLQIYNETLQKFNYVLAIVVEQVESIQKSLIIKNSFKLDSYLEKTLYLKCKSLSSREFFLSQLKQRRFLIDENQYYGKGNWMKPENYTNWKKYEESTINKQSQQVISKDDHLKSIWSLKSTSGSNGNGKNDPIGVISIKVVGARELIQKESSGKPESFIEIDFPNSMKKRTKRVSSLNPIWKEYFSFQITKQQLSDEIEFTIWDGRNSSTSSSSSSSSSDKSDKLHFLGKCKFTIKELMVYLKREVNWFPLQKRTSRSRISGDLKLQFHYLPFPELQTSSTIDYIYFFQILFDKLIEVDSVNLINSNSNDENNIGSTSSISNSPSIISPTLKSNNKLLMGQSPSSPILNNNTTTAGNIKFKKQIQLSNQSNLLLKEYCERYGIMQHTYNLIYLKKLVASTIKYTSLDTIPEIRNILKSILEDKFGEIGLTKQEEQILKESISTLAIACKSWLSHFHAIFPNNQPNGSLRILIDIYYLLRNSQVLDQLSSSNQLPPLHELMNETYQNRYRHAIKMANEIGKPATIIKPNVKLSNDQTLITTPQPLSNNASILVKVCDLLLYNLEIDQRLFNKEFPSDTPILLISIQIYTTQLSKEIDQLTEIGANNSQDLQDFFQLYLKLKETMSKFKEIHQKLVLVPIPVLFKQVIMQWILYCADQTKERIDYLCKNENWTPVSSKDTCLHSSSVGEVILTCYHALDVIKSLRWEDLQRDHKNSEHTLFEIFGNFTMVVSESVIYYTQVIRDISLEALDQSADDIFKLSESYSSALVNTIQKVSLRFNNIQACIGHAEDLIQVLQRIMISYKLSQSIVNEMATNTYLAISNNVRTLIDRIYHRLLPVINGEIYKLLGIDLDSKNKNIVMDFFQKIEKISMEAAVSLSSTTEKQPSVKVRLEPLLNYISSKLALFSQYLYYPLTKQLLKRCFGGIINAMDEIIFPNSQNSQLNLTSTQLDTIEQMIKIFGEFFFVDGEGLSQKAIDKQSERFMIIVLAYREAINSGVRDFDPLGLKNALKNINFTNLKPDLTVLKKLNIKGIPKQLDVFSLIKKSIDKKQDDRKKRDEIRILKKQQLERDQQLLEKQQQRY